VCNNLSHLPKDNNNGTSTHTRHLIHIESSSHAVCVIRKCSAERGAESDQKPTLSVFLISARVLVGATTGACKENVQWPHLLKDSPNSKNSSASNGLQLHSLVALGALPWQVQGCSQLPLPQQLRRLIVAGTDGGRYGGRTGFSETSSFGCSCMVEPDSP
jgi:hypothetical protein